jgi:protein-S-isoprenylcysteine O-methyltransferase Ste14
LTVSAIGVKKDTQRAGGAWIFLLVILGGLFLWRVGAEDRLMSQQFPDEYPDYKKRTKALTPFIW